MPTIHLVNLIKTKLQFTQGRNQHPRAVRRPRAVVPSCRFTVSARQTGRAGRYADGPAGQVLDFLMEQGFSDRRLFWGRKV